MANKLSDVVAKFQAIVTAQSGLAKFVFDDLSSVNIDRDKDYKLLLLKPPNSAIPNFAQPFEVYAIEMFIFDRYDQAEQDTTALAVKWSEIQDEGLAFLTTLFSDQQNFRRGADGAIEMVRGYFDQSDQLIVIQYNFPLNVLDCI